MERQDDPLLITAVNEVSRGERGPETLAFIKSLDGYLDIPPHLKRVLFSTNLRSDVYNIQQLVPSKGKIVSYKGKDKGNTRHIKAPKVWDIKSTLVNNIIFLH